MAQRNGNCYLCREVSAKRSGEEVTIATRGREKTSANVCRRKRVRHQRFVILGRRGCRIEGREKGRAFGENTRRKTSKQKTIFAGWVISKKKGGFLKGEEREKKRLQRWGGKGRPYVYSVKGGVVNNIDSAKFYMCSIKKGEKEKKKKKRGGGRSVNEATGRMVCFVLGKRTANSERLDETRSYPEEKEGWSLSLKVVREDAIAYELAKKKGGVFARTRKEVTK